MPSTWKGWPLLKAIRYLRILDPFSTRKRYLREATLKLGCMVPFTRIVLPVSPFRLPV